MLFDLPSDAAKIAIFNVTGDVDLPAGVLLNDVRRGSDPQFRDIAQRYLSTRRRGRLWVSILGL